MTLLKARAKTLGLLAIITILVRWKTLLTHQFSLLATGEATSQAYSWLTFSIHCIRQAKLPAWDPYTFAGHSFIGEMQTSGLSPFNLLLAIFPLDRLGLVSTAVYNWYFALLVFLALTFMYLLARDLGLGHVPALISAICFALGGFWSHTSTWPDMMQSGIWLPLIFLFCRRALLAETRPLTARSAIRCGLAMGMAVLAGRLHIVMMDAIAVVALIAVYTWHARRPSPQSTAGIPPISLARATFLVLLVGLVCFGLGAVQILPSIEYGTHSWRWVGDAAFPSNQKIPYFYASNHTAMPRSLLAFVFPRAFGASYGIGEFISPYIGIFPLILVCLAFLKRWHVIWVRFCGLLAIAAWLYALGPLSLLHGLSYATIPFIWMLRESARMLYLVSFSLALLAGFGAQVLLTTPPENQYETPGFDRLLLWVAVFCAAALAVAGLFNLGSINSLSEFSIAIVLLSYWLYRLVRRHPQAPALRFAIVALILFDLSPLDFSADNLASLQQLKQEPAIEKLQNAGGLVAFLRSQPGVFRTAIAADQPPNLGDAFSVLTTSGKGATLDTAYMTMWGRSDLLNVRYTVKPANAPDPGALYRDPAWKVYRNDNAAGPAWIVHRATQLPLALIKQRLSDPRWNLLTDAFVEHPPPVLEPVAAPLKESAVIEDYGIDHIRLKVHAASRGLLVLSEIYDPGWKASLNGRETPVLRADGGLRAVPVPAGDSIAEFRYAPAPLRAGAVISLVTIALALATLPLRRRISNGTVIGF